MSNIRLLKGDCIKQLKKLEDNSVDSVVTDPPYGIGFMGKAWDTFDTKNVKKANKEATKSYQKTKEEKVKNNPNLKGRKNAPIGGKATFAGTYDLSPKGTLAYQKFCEEWGRECLRVLKPGGHLLSSCSPRMYHRMSVGLEDAGFEIRDQIMWVYGSGFPKSHNIGKALDKNGGNGDLVYEVAEKLKEARESRGITKTQADKLFCNGSTNYSWLEGRKDGVRLPEDDLFQKIVNEWPELKPYQEKVKSANREIVGKYDTDMGGLGGERLGSKGGDITLPATPIAQQYEGWGTALKPAHEPIVMARKPFKGSVANNVLEWGTGGINIDECRIGYEDTPNPATNPKYRQTQDYKMPEPGQESKGAVSFTSGKNGINTEGRFPANIIFDEEAGKILDEQSGILKSGYVADHHKTKDSSWFGASGQYSKNSTQRNDLVGGASRFFYCPKASKKDRNEGVEHLEVKRPDTRTDKGMGSFTEKGVQPQHNSHPTVKPTDLMTYLIRLVTPKGGTVLDPFMGSGSTGKASVREGMDFIGIEREDEYMEIAKTRIEHEQKKHNHRKFFNEV